MTTPRAASPRSRAELRAAAGVLVVWRPSALPAAPASGQPPGVPSDPSEGDEPLLAVWDDGSVTALHGHVDLGTGLATALAQIVAEELEVEPAAVCVLLGHTALVPNQGSTIASASLQVHAEPLRRAAAQARQWLRAEASRGDAETHALLAGRRIDLLLDPDAPLKPPDIYRVVGTSLPRTDIPPKARGELVFVHDMRVPGMLHGRVVRPPYAGVDAGEFVGNTLRAVDEGSIAHLAGIRAVVVIRDFVGVVAEREEDAERAMHALKVEWGDWPGSRPLDDLAHALKTNPATRRVLVEHGDVAAAIDGAVQPLRREYLWPYQLHASIGPSCALADWRGGTDAGPALTVWAGTQNPHALRADLARLTGLADPAVEVVRMEAAGCYGRNGADDVAADAALLSRAVGAPVRVQLTRAQEHLWEPKGAAQLMQVAGGLDAEGRPVGYDFQTSYPSNGAPTLALLLTRTLEPVAQAYEMGDRTAVPPYAYPALRVVANDMAPILRASWLRGVSALPNAFAHESFVDELASAAGADPVAFRLAQLPDPRAAELVRATAARAGWLAHTAPQQQPAAGDWLKGQGFAYARYVHSRFPGFGAAWAAWVADVEVHRVTGEVHVARIVVGHDAGLEVNPAGVRHQIHGNVLQTTSRALKESLPLDPVRHIPVAREWGAYPILSFREVPVVEVLTMPRPGEPPLGAGESASVPGTAAIANAIFDATGVRLRAPPFTPEVVRAALQPLPAPTAASPRSISLSRQSGSPANAPWPRRRFWKRAALLASAALGLGGALLGSVIGIGRSALAPIAAGSADVYNAATLERGRRLAAAGNCVVCHTAPGGEPNAGGRALATPFGTVWSTNLTPDPATGLGAWSLAAFTRALREGVSRDGHLLYPAFPYTSFTKMTDADLTALYAWLMAQAPVASRPPETRLPYPFGARPLLAAWNALYLDPGPTAPVATRSAEWTRGAYLVEGVAHCGACHTPRDALGGERSGTRHLAGGWAGGWEAPALTALTRAPRRWSEADFYDYLRHGHSSNHGSAVGPMARVVGQLEALPDADLRAIAAYLGASNPPEAAVPAPQSLPTDDATHRVYTTACGACHHDDDGPRLLGQNIPLALNTNLHAAQPDNLLRVILEGIRVPATRRQGFMPGFDAAFDDRQVARLAGYLRQRYAPQQPAWEGLEAASARVRATPSGP